ncbi:MAG: hypothetical protein ACRD0D_00655, partial [Acidimicrobiales bacterium]
MTMRTTTRVAPALVTTAVAGLVVALAGAVAWACVPLATFNLTPGQARAGETVTLSGGPYNDNPVVVRFGALDGPVLGTFTPQGGRIDGATVTIPAATPAGDHVLVATQDAAAGRTTWG